MGTPTTRYQNLEAKSLTFKSVCVSPGSWIPKDSKTSRNLGITKTTMMPITPSATSRTIAG